MLGYPHMRVQWWVPGYLPTGDAPRLPTEPANLARGLTWWEKASGCQVAASLQEWVPGFGLMGGAHLHTRDGPWQGVTAAGCSLTPLRVCLSGILLFLVFLFQCPAVLVVLGKKKKVIYCEALAENHFLNHCTILIRQQYCIQSREDLQGG